MEQIKFRAKRLDTNDWVYGGSVVKLTGGDSLYMPSIYEKCTTTHESETDNITAIENCTLYKVDRDTLNLFTGKTDVAGTELYEGDVIELLDGSKAVIEFGTFNGYCPIDKRWIDSVGFHCRCLTIERPALPLGPTEEYATKVCTIDEYEDQHE